jgi:hypothetical protein
LSAGLSNIFHNRFIGTALVLSIVQGGYVMKKFQVEILFQIDDEFMSLVPLHRNYINYLINNDVIDMYAVSMESQRIWITINAESKTEADQYLMKSPLFKYWDYEIEELFVYDGQLFRFPCFQLN